MIALLSAIFRNVAQKFDVAHLSSQCSGFKETYFGRKSRFLGLSVVLIKMRRASENSMCLDSKSKHKNESLSSSGRRAKLYACSECV